MSTLTTGSWILHNLGIATSVGGTLFGQGAFAPALEKDIDDEQQRAQISDDAWSRYSWWNLAAHGVVAATWFTGRTMLTGREVSSKARTLTRVKDVLVIASLVSGVTSVILGKVLGAKAKRQADRIKVDGDDESRRIDGLRKAVRVMGAANIATNAAMGAVTTTLSMEAAKSLPFAVVSRLLP